MSDQPFTYLCCPVVVLRVTEAQVMGDNVADTLRDELLAVYGVSQAVHVVLDMQAVNYLSSAGIRPLLALNKAVHAREGRLVLCNLTATVEEVLLLMRLISSSRASPATFEKQADVPAAVLSLYHNTPHGN